MAHAKAEREPIESGPGSKPSGQLVILSTPIGNLGDLSPRAADQLAQADLIACEDTRITSKLLQHLGLKRSLLAYHDHNAAKVRPQLIEAMKCGKVVALVSDAGTPLISDPGYKLVEEAQAQAIAITAVPGPAAFLTALVLSGLPCDRFFFAGFLPNKKAARRAALADLSGIPGSLIFYETAPRLVDSLDDCYAVLGDRQAAVARELTKRFEEVRRDSLSDLHTHYKVSGPPKGEIVLVIGPAAAEEAKAADPATVDRLLQEALAEMKVKDAAAMVAESLGLPRRRLYQRALELRSQASNEGEAR